MTPQEIFDTAVGGVIKQGRPGWSEKTGIQTITPEGYRCAIGFLAPEDLPKQHRTKTDDGEIWLSWGLRPIKEAIGAAEGVADDLTAALRRAHDDGPALVLVELNGPMKPHPNFLENFKAEARRIAAEFCLSPAVIGD